MPTYSSSTNCFNSFLDFTKSIVKPSNNYEFRVARTTRELNDWLLDSKKSKIIDK